MRVAVPSPSRKTANYYAGRAEDNYQTFTLVNRRIEDYVARQQHEKGVMLSTDKPLTDMLADRTRYIQLTIMYSNLSLMHRLLNYGDGND